MNPAVHLALTATGLRAARHSASPAAVVGPIALVILGVGWMVPVTAYCAFGLVGLAAVGILGAALVAAFICSELDSRARASAGRHAAYVAAFLPRLGPLARTVVDNAASAQAFRAAGLPAPLWGEIRPTAYGAALTISGIPLALIQARAYALAAALGAGGLPVTVQPTWHAHVVTLHITAR